MGVVQVNRVEEKRNLDLFSVGEDGRLPELIVQSLEAPLDVTVGNVNGVNFDEFLKTLCLKNVESHIRGDVSVSSVRNYFLEKSERLVHKSVVFQLIVSGNSHTNYLNGLKFPEEYIFATANRTFTTITGTKTFTKPVRTTDIIINDKINGFMPNDLITLDLEQIIPKTVEFSDLEVTEKFDVSNM